MMSHNRLAWFIFAAALILRLAFIAASPERPMSLDDSAEWNRMGVRFAEGAGFLTQTEDLDPKRPPVYPLFISAIYRMQGMENFFAVKAAQCVINSAACVLLFLIAARFVHPGAALLAGLVCAVYPPSLIYCGILQSETLFGFLLMLFVYLWFRHRENASWATLAGCGAVLGLVNLTRGTTLFFPFVLLAAPFVFRREMARRKQYIITAVVSLLVVAPWTWRNYKVYHAFIPIISGGTELVWFGTLPIESQKVYGDAPEFKALSVPADLRESEKFYL